MIIIIDDRTNQPGHQSVGGRVQYIHKHPRPPLSQRRRLRSLVMSAVEAPLPAASGPREGIVRNSYLTNSGES